MAEGNFSGSLWFGRGLRLAVVVGLASSAWHAWSVFSTYSDDLDQLMSMRIVHECAARASDESLNKHVNEFGNINVKGVYCSDQDFWVSPMEIAEVRSGVAKYETPYKPFDGAGTAIIAALGFLATIVATAIGVGLIKAVRWVWTG